MQNEEFHSDNRFGGRQEPLSPLVEELQERGGPQGEESVPLKLRLLRWLFPDINRRRAKRFTSPGLVAYYWTGGSPHCYDVANISATGVYLRTKERWAPETLIQMTIQKGKPGGDEIDASLQVLSEVVRWGNDGTGFNFILKDYDDALARDVLPGDALERKSVEKFLKRLDLIENR